MSQLTRKEADNMFSVFTTKRLVLRLINSGQSNLSDKQDVLVGDAFAMAYKLLKYAQQKQNIELFKRVYEATKELVPSEQIKSVMKYPEMYEKMVRIKQYFVEDAALLAQKMCIR